MTAEERKLRKQIFTRLEIPNHVIAKVDRIAKFKNSRPGCQGQADWDRLHVVAVGVAKYMEDLEDIYGSEFKEFGVVEKVTDPKAIDGLSESVPNRSAPHALAGV